MKRLFAYILAAAAAGSGVFPVSVWGAQNATAEASAPGQERQDLDFADGLYQRGMFDSAARQYADFLRQYPLSKQKEAALFRRGESLYQHAAKWNKTDPLQAKIFLVEARGAFQQWVRDYPQGSRIHEAQLRLGEVSYKIGDAKGALEALNRVVKESKENTLLEAALFYAGRSHENLKEWKEAENRYRQIRDSFPKGEFAALSTFLLADVLGKTERSQEAADLLTDFWENPGKYKIPEGSSLVEDSKLLSAQMLYQLDKFDEASKAYEAFVSANPGSENTAKAKYGAAWAEYRQKNYEKALQIADTLQRQSLPADLAIGIIFLQGTCSYQQKLYDDAILYFREVIADPKAGEYRDRAWYQLAWSYYLSQKYEAAAAECKRILQQGGDPSAMGNVHFLLGQSCAQQQDFDNAILELDLVRKINAQGEYAEESLYLLADLLYRKERYDEAGEAFESYYRDYPSASRAEEALLWASNARFAAKNYAKAVENADRLLKAYPESKALQEVLYRKGLALYQLKKYDEALAAFDELLAKTEEEKRKPEALYWQAYIYELQKDRVKASEKYGVLLENYPSFPNRDEALLRKSLCDYKEKKFEAAYAGFQNILGGEKGNQIPAEVIFWMIFFADEKEKHEEALATAERVLSVFPQDSFQERALIAKGNQLIALKKWKEANQNAEDFLKRFPESLFKPEIFWSQGMALEGLEKSKEALDLLEKSLMELNRLGDPDPVFAASLYLDRGRLLEKMGKTKEGLESYLRVAIIYDHPRYTPEAMYRSIRAHSSLEEKDSAQKMYNELCERYPDSPWRKKADEEFGAAMKKNE
ncbi:MAG: tetratricopeptide repeat protein [Candidatus Omnitrophota bacterium]